MSDLPNTSKIQEIANKVKESGKLASDFFSSETTKFAELLAKDISALDNELKEIIRKSLDVTAETEKLAREIIEFNKQKGGFIELKTRLDKQAESLREREENLTTLSKVLDNKQLMLNGRETELAEREHRVKEAGF